MPNDALIKGFLSAKQALMQRIGDLYGEITVCQRDVARLDEMMARYGVVSAEIAGADDEPAASSEDRNTTAQSEEEPRESIEDVVRRLISQQGSVETARQVTEWLLRTGQIQNPSTVKALYESFPQVLRAEYNPSPGTAVEALRQQIRSWVAREGSLLFYQDGTVGLVMQPIEEVQSR